MRPTGGLYQTGAVCKWAYGLAVKGIITAKAVTLFESSLRCGASGVKRLPCPSGQINQNKKAKK
ncbi:hypothetical protein FNH69_22630 [Salmonella enterica subsp. salamae]|nr:hypothetical protein [Salmonella enterica subsp. salamae]